MKRPTFFEGVVVALILSFAGSAVYHALTFLFTSDWVLRVLIAGIGLAYIVYLLGRSCERIGRIAAFAGWALAAGAAGFMSLPLIVYLLVHIGLIWLIRSLYFYSSVLATLGDFGLVALSLAATIWAATQTGSVFISIWCFFLVQALFVTIPTTLHRKLGEARSEGDGEDRFRHAHRAAEAALHKLLSTPTGEIK